MSIASKPAAARSMKHAKKPEGSASLGKGGDDASIDVATSGIGAMQVDADPAEALAAGFSDRVVHWAIASGAPASTLDALRTAARMTSLATSAGHVCIHLDEVAQALPSSPGLFLADMLLASTMVGTPAKPMSMPLILDDQGRLYLHRYFDYERRLARRLVLLASAPVAVVDVAAKERLDAMFARRSSGSKDVGDGAADRATSAEYAESRASVDWQKIAGALALDRRLTIISGGPGTGKTTTVVNLLACILAQDPECRIRLAAPTGKAAARMIEAIRQQSDRLDPDIRARLPGESYTVHRLLGVVPDSSDFRHGIDNPLPIDLLVVDEASMLDLALATKLLEAVPLSARIILLGDKHQLSAVESGAVFSELSADPTLSAECVARLSALTGIVAERIEPAAPNTLPGLRDSVVWFSENFRFSAHSGIGHLAALVNKGDADCAIAWLRSVDDGPEDKVADTADHSVRWIEDAGSTPSLATMRLIFKDGDAYLRAAGNNLDDKAALFEAFARSRVLCAEREGPRGVEGINRAMSQHFRRSLAHPLDPGNRSEWYPGRPVMVLRNDYVLKLYNGDTGLALPDASGVLTVWFPQGNGEFRAIAPVRLPAHETAFAMTVHKAQGSEFDCVLLVLPSKPTRAVTRELLYTAVTRARKRVALVAGDDVIAKAIVSPTRRYSGLIDRVQEAKRCSRIILSPTGC